MPQVWVTYEELADLFACEPADARLLASRQGLERLSGRDGRTRTKLCSIGLARFVQRLRDPNVALELAIRKHDVDQAFVANSYNRRYYPWID